MRGKSYRPSSPARLERLEDRVLFAVPDGFSQTLLAGGLSGPTAMAVAPDGRVFVSRQNGEIRIIKNGQLLPDPFMVVNTLKDGERGLFGVAFDPDFASNHYLYAYYTASSPSPHNRVSRYTASGDAVVPGSGKVLLDQAPLGTSKSHNGGDMHFGPDGKLYIAVGENAQPDLAQSLNSTFGKVLRINPDGTIPTDNPFYNQTTGVNRSIWALGLRNPYTFNVQPGTGKTYVNDVGHIGDTAWEEINLLSKGANYGWPTVQGSQAGQPQFQNPVYTYQHGPGGMNGVAITGGAFYNPPAGVARPFPNSFTGDYFFADYGGGWVKTLDANGGGVSDFATGLVFPVDLEVAADGSLLYLQRGSPASPAGVYRIRREATANPPSILAQPAAVTVSPGEPAAFTVNATGSGTLSYQWLRDGDEIPGATNPSYTLPDPQFPDNGAVFSVRVSNTAGPTMSSGAKLTVTTNAAPQPVIDAPAAGFRFVAGQPVEFSGSATDPEDGQLGPTSLTWSVSYFTGGLDRPFVPAFSGQAGGTFTPDTVTPYLGTDVSYRIYLTATDSLGRTRTVTRDLAPEVSQFTLVTNVPGLTLTLDGNPYVAPKTTSSVVGLRRPIAAPASQVVGGKAYDFVAWSDGKPAAHTISAPASPTTYTATYQVRAGTRQIAAAADAWVSQQAPATNYGTAAALDARRSASVYARVTYLTFDLSTIGTIGSAKLKLWGHQTVAGPAVTVAAYRVSSTTWNENTVTWNTRPALGAAMGNVSVSGTSAKWYTWDVTAYLKAEKAAGRNRVTIALFGATATTPIAEFNSRQAAANRPVLEVA